MAYGLNNGFVFPTTAGPGQSYTVPPQNYYQQAANPPAQTMILVNNEQEASNWNVLPGNSLFFMDSNNKLFYIKTVDFSGMVTFRRFKFEEVNEKEEEPSVDFITREEFERRLSSINKGNKPYAQQKKGE